MESPLDFIVVAVATAIALVTGTVLAVIYAHILVWLWFAL